MAANSRLFWAALSTAICAVALASCSQQTSQNNDAAMPSEQAAVNAAEQAPRAIPSFAGRWSHNVSHLADPEEGEGPVSHIPGMRHLYGQERGRGLPGTDLWIGNHEDPVLQPWAAERVKARGDKEQEMGQSDWQMLQLCMLVGTPHVLLLRDPVEFLQEPGMITIVYHRDQQTRRIYLDEEHREAIAPSPYGHSVGWYEGGELVIDTLGMSVEGPIDYYGTPHTEQLHVIERYRVIEDGAALHVDVWVEDPGSFTSPWSASQRYDRSLRTQYEEIRCAENPKDIEGGEYPIPRDDTPDF